MQNQYVGECENKVELKVEIPNKKDNNEQESQVVTQCPVVYANI